MDIALALTNILGVRDIAIHVIALVELVRRTSAFIVNLIEVAGDLLINGFLFSLKTSQNVLLRTLSLCLSISEVISEFILDVSEKLSNIAHAISLPAIYLYRTILYCYETTYGAFILMFQFMSFWCSTAIQFISSWSTSTSQFISSWCIYIFDLCLGLAKFIASIPEYLKQCLISLGSTIWLVATMIPLGIVYLSTSCIYFVGRCCEEVSSVFWLLLEGSTALLNKGILYWSDMPVESALGLVIGSTAIIIVVKYGSLCLKTVISLVERAWNIVFNSHPISGLPDTYAVNEEHEKAEEILCVICQDRVRRVVSFPCRHMCMCRECSDELAMRREPCPVCRRRVARTMTVYT